MRIAGVRGIGVSRVVRRSVWAGIVSALLTCAPAAATTFSPNTTADGNNGSCGNPCTLRDAINAADTAPGNDVVIPAGDYKLSLGQLPITQNMSVAGAGPRTTTIDAEGTSRVIYVNPGIQAAIHDLTVKGGAAGPSSSPFFGEGGGILTEGTLSLRRTAIVGNTSTITGGGLSAPFKGNSSGNGAVTTTIEDSLIADNKVTGGGGAGSGGGLNLFGDATVTNSTVTGNSVDNPGGNEGGGITSAANFFSASPGTLTLLNVTVAGNSIPSPSGLGGGLSGANFNLFPVTPPLLSNLTAKNTLIAGNTVGGAAQDCSQVNLVSSSHNLSGDSTCGFSDSGSLQNANPQLGSLADNGGPTNTLKPADASPAKNAGDNNGCPASDQRGIGRPQAGICDIGAVELKAPDLQLRQAPLGRAGRAGTLASEAKRKPRKRGFLITITNLGEQGSRGTELKIRIRGRTRKLIRSSPCALQKTKKKRKKGRRRKPKVKLLSCPLSDLSPGTSTKFTLRVKPPKRGRKVRSTATVSNQLGEASPSGHSATTVLRLKKKRPRR
jgi:CSLREA domain-containing protein